MVIASPVFTLDFCGVIDTVPAAKVVTVVDAAVVDVVEVNVDETVSTFWLRPVTRTTTRATRMMSTSPDITSAATFNDFPLEGGSGGGPTMTWCAPFPSEAWSPGGKECRGLTPG